MQVFPAMSKHHSHLLQMFNNTVAGYDRIWDVAQNVWKGLTSSMVARAFVLAFRIMQKSLMKMATIIGLVMVLCTAL
jgi:hypothetical protein